MFKRYVRKVLSIYFVISFISIVVCLGLIAVDCVNKVSTGEYKILPAFNFFQYKVGGTPDEQADTLLQVVAYDEQLYELGRYYDDPLWLFINISTAVSLCNLPLYYVLQYLLDIRFPRYAWAFMITGVAISLFFIFAARVFPKGTYAMDQIEFRYPVAYLTGGELATPVIIPAIALLEFTVIRKLIRKE